MSDTTPRLDLPLLQPAQAQKHVTHNEALARLDGLVQLALDGLGTETPPDTPAEGEIHALGAAPEGAWSGRAGMLALRQGGGWVFLAPRPGWRAWDRAAGALLVHGPAGWAPLPAPEEAERLGLGTAADGQNRLAVASEAALFTHQGGDHRLKINKAAAADTASLLFQSGFSGRAEIGLTGGDALSLKLSADGATWTTLLVADPAGLACPAPLRAESLFGTGEATPAVIVAGSLAVTASSHALSPEGGAASDDLDTITGGAEGDILVLKVATQGLAMTIRHGTGNIRCGADRLLDGAADRILLHRGASGEWHMLSHTRN